MGDCCQSLSEPTSFLSLAFSPWGCFPGACPPQLLIPFPSSKSMGSRGQLSKNFSPFRAAWRRWRGLYPVSPDTQPPALLIEAPTLPTGRLPRAPQVDRTVLQRTRCWPWRSLVHWCRMAPRGSGRGSPLSLPQRRVWSLRMLASRTRENSRERGLRGAVAGPGRAGCPLRSGRKGREAGARSSLGRGRAPARPPGSGVGSSLAPTCSGRGWFRPE